MKKIFKTVAFLLASAYAFAQAPQSFNYQGLARDNAGATMATKTISVKATILDGTATGTSVYSETFSPSTNAFGLFTLGIGSGTPVAGTFSAIKWSTGNKFLKIEIDPNGGSSYALSGTTQLLSVPYAMYAANAGESKTPKLTVSSVGDTLFSGEKSNWVIIPGISAVNKPTVKDADGNTYDVVKIGTQTWMAENLRTTKYNDGTPITTFKGADLAGPWFANTTGAYTFSSEDISNRIPYGALYNLFAAQSKKICPTDWHVATTADWTTMIDLLGGNDVAAEKLKQTGTINWLAPNVATNSSGFNAVGGGQKFDGSNTYQHFKEFAEFWRPDGTLLYILNTEKKIFVSTPAPQYGFSIRCVKN